MNGVHHTAQECEALVREALGRMATDLRAQVSAWATKERAELVLGQGARAGASLPDLLAALASLPEVFRKEGLTGARFDQEVGAFHLRAALNDALHLQAERRAEREAELDAYPSTLTVMECR